MYGLGDYSPENIVIPNTYKGLPVTWIDAEAFEGIAAIISITIPANVIGIESHSFSMCNNLKNIYINKPEDSITGSPWGAPNATVHWNI